MIWETKCWGQVCHCFSSPEVAVSILQVEAGFRCSRHYHRFRSNRFLVLSGMIEVWEWELGPGFSVEVGFDKPARVRQLRAGNMVDVRAMVYHMFRVIESGTVIEVYEPDGGQVAANDIVRYDEGGVFDGGA